MTNRNPDSALRGLLAQYHEERANRRLDENKRWNPVLRYLLFGFNTAFWAAGILILVVGFYAWFEKDTFRNIGRLASSRTLFFDPALVFILLGCIIFTITFIGCVGALRENTCCLFSFSFILSILLVLQLSVLVFIFLYKDKARRYDELFETRFKTIFELLRASYQESEQLLRFQIEKLEANTREEVEKHLMEMIKKYREDEDLQDLIDWIQKDWLHCCGVNTYRDWESNIYFNCSSVKVGSVEACGVPFSCCKPNLYQDSQLHIDRQCGFGKLELTANTDTIFVEGCFKKFLKWIEAKIMPIAVVVTVLACIQAMSICFAYRLRFGIIAEKTRWKLTSALQ